MNGPFALDSDLNSSDFENITNNFTNRAQFLETDATLLGWLGEDDDVDLFQVIAGSGQINLELTMVNHDGNSGNTTTNVDLDMFVVDAQENTDNVGGTYAKVENAYIPAGEGDIYYVIIDHYRVDNSVPSAYVLTQTPQFASSEAQKDASSRANADFDLEKILVAKRPVFSGFNLNQTENELTQEMGNIDGGLVDMTLNELSAMAGLGNDENYKSTLKETLPEVYEKGRYMKAISVLSDRSPNLFVEPSWNRYIQVESFTQDPSYNTYQWWNFDVVNIPEALNILGQETKPVNVAVLDSGSPYIVDPAFDGSIFDTEWGWDMEDNDSLSDDVEFEQGSFSHGTHVGSTISMLNDGIDGNGMSARVTPIRVCYQNGCGPTYSAYLYLNGDDNDSGTNFAQRSGGQTLHSMNMSYGGSGGSATSSSCVKLGELADKGVLIASSSGNGGVGSIGWPSACPKVYAVGATNGTDRRSSYSSTNEYVDFAAPGGEYSDWNADGVDDLVYAYAYVDSYVQTSNNGNPLIGAQGTSMASPHGAGFLGLIKYYYEDVVKPFEANASLPTSLTHIEVDKMLAANLLTNDVNKTARPNDSVAKPGWDEDLGYGIIDLEKAINAIDSFNDGYFTSFDALPYYEGPSSVVLTSDDSYQGQFSIIPSGAAGQGFNDVTYTYPTELLEVTGNGLDFTVKKPDDYDFAGWVSTTILFDFPLVEGAQLPFDNYELLSVGVNVIFNVIGEAYAINFPALKARLLDPNGIPVQEVISSVTEGQGNFAFTGIEPGNYRMVIGSDINGDNSWGGPGEMTGSSELFEITNSNISNLEISLAPELAGVANSAPVISSTPPTDAYVNQLYFYGVNASDDDGDSLTFTLELTNKEDGSSANFVTMSSIGRVQGTPREDDIGEYSARIIVSDGTDAAIQAFDLIVNE